MQHRCVTVRIFTICNAVTVPANLKPMPLIAQTQNIGNELA